MKEAFTSIGSRDFRQRYEGTYGFYNTDSGEKRLVLLNSINEREVRFSDAARQEYVALADGGTEFEFIAPVKKLFAAADTILYISRRVARQFQRGVSLANTRIVNLATNSEVSITFTRLVQAYESEPVNVPLRVTMYRADKRDTVLLSDMLAIVGTQLYLYGEPIGEVNKEEKKFILSEDLFRQEVIDVINANQLSFTVEIA